MLPPAFTVEIGASGHDEHERKEGERQNLKLQITNEYPIETHDLNIELEPNIESMKERERL